MDGQNPQGSDQLHGWKEIAAHIGKGTRTAQRWEKLGMPVHRVPSLDGVVYALKSEIDLWRRSSAGLEAEESATRGSPFISQSTQFSRRSILLFVLGLLGLASAAFAAWSLFSRAPLEIRLGSEGSALQGGSFRFRATGERPDLVSVNRLMRDPNGRKAVLAPVVNRDREGAFVWVFSTDCQTLPGVHTISLVDAGGEEVSKAIAVEVSRNPQCNGPVPDILAEAVTVLPEVIAPGGDIVCRFTLRNQGEGTANASVTRLRLSQSAMRSSISDIRLGDVAARSMNPGDVSSFEHKVTIPSTVAPGIYYVWIVADNGSHNIESFSHNNYARSGPLVVGPARR